MKQRAVFTIDDIRKSSCAKLNDHLLVDTKQNKKARRTKFNNEKVEWEGIVFDSRKEYNRYRELLLMQKAGLIGMLQRQVKFLLIEANETEKKTEYWADHVWIDQKTGEKVVEDVKSDATRKLSTYILKRKLMLSVHGIKIKEY